eukprot:1409217-Rhodomonas_salina.1
MDDKRHLMHAREKYHKRKEAKKTGEKVEEHEDEDVQDEGNEGKTPLHLAALLGHTKIVEVASVATSSPSNCAPGNHCRALSTRRASRVAVRGFLELLDPQADT